MHSKANYYQLWEAIAIFFHPTCLISAEKCLDFVWTIPTLRNVTYEEIIHALTSIPVISVIGSEMLFLSLQLRPKYKLPFPTIPLKENGAAYLFPSQEKRREGNKHAPENLNRFADSQIIHFRRMQLVSPPANQQFLGAGLVSAQPRE